MNAQIASATCIYGSVRNSPVHASPLIAAMGLLEIIARQVAHINECGDDVYGFFHGRRYVALMDENDIVRDATSRNHKYMTFLAGS
jgi:hypothetical protein